MAASTPAPNPPPSPKTQLDELTRRATTNQNSIDTATKDTASIQPDIAVLQKGIGEIDQIVKGYSQGAVAINDSISGYQSFVQQETKMAIAAVGASKDALDKIVSDYDASITGQIAALPGLTSDVEKTATASVRAQQVVSAKQAAYDGLKATLSSLQAAVNDLKSLKTQITAAADSGNFNVMYFLVGEIASIEKTTVPTPTSLQASLETALCDLKQALSDQRGTKLAADAAVAALTAAQKQLNDAKTNRRASLLEMMVKNWTPPPSTPMVKPKV
ncbi:MAG TPA: hypothetical protein VHR66_25775 [Gemmataceae bacterium]|jgi:small-conductance mechanosensitive channel|nr:hypothetical protein [Gemmataceae bacterium]